MSVSFESERLLIRMSDVKFTDALLDYYSRNREFFSHAEPARTDTYYTREQRILLLLLLIKGGP